MYLQSNQHICVSNSGRVIADIFGHVFKKNVNVEIKMVDPHTYVEYNMNILGWYICTRCLNIN